MRAKLGRVVVGMTLFSLALGPAVTRPAHALSLPTPDVCYGTGATSNLTQTGEWEMDGGFFCGLHTYLFYGTTTANPVDLCLGSGASSIVFKGTISKDDAPEVNASWTVIGAGGVYSLTMTSAVGPFVGTVATYDPLFCSPGFASQAFAVVHVSPHNPVPDVLWCKAAGVEGPNVWGYGRDPSYSGPASGTGTCRSARASWDLQYSGMWWEGSGFCPGAYQLDVTVTNRSTGNSLVQNQHWQETDQNGERFLQISSNGVAPGGVGTIEESPDPCTYPSTMTTSATFVFTIPR